MAVRLARPFIGCMETMNSILMKYEMIAVQTPEHRSITSFSLQFDLTQKKNCQQTHSAASINLNHVDKHAIQVMIHWHLLNECCKYIKRTQTQPTHTDTLSTQRAKTPFVWFAVRTNVAQWHIIF